MEAEAMLIGKWANFQELEEALNLDELNLLVKALYERERRQQRFAAALKGIKLDEPDKDEIQTRFERAEFRAQARIQGMSEEEIDQAEERETLSGLGFTLTKE